MRGARQLLTLRGSTGIRRGAALNDLGVIEDGSVLIRDGVISAIGPTRRIENLSEARGALEIRAHGRVVMPGLIDSGMRLLVAEPDAKPKSISVAKTLQEAATVLRQSLYYGTTRAEIKAGAMPENEIRTLRHASKIRRLREEIVCTWLMRPLEGTDSGERAALREQNFQQAMKKKYARFVDLDIVPSQWPQASLLLKMIAQYGFRRKLTWRGAADGNLAVMIQRFGIRTVSQIQSLSEQWAIELARLPFLLFLSPGTECLEGDSSLLKVRENGCARSP